MESRKKRRRIRKRTTTTKQVQEQEAFNIKMIGMQWYVLWDVSLTSFLDQPAEKSVCGTRTDDWERTPLVTLEDFCLYKYLKKINEKGQDTYIVIIKLSVYSGKKI